MYCLEDFKGRMDSCYELLKNPDEWKKLPLLNTTSEHLLQEGQLVRFQGMIQDMFNPTIYFVEYEVQNTKTGETQVRKGEFHDIELEEDEIVLFESKKTIPKDRKPYYCVSTPGLNEWVEEYHQHQQGEVIELLQQALRLEQSGTNEKKRCSCDDQADHVTSDSPNKRLCCGKTASSEECSSESRDNAQKNDHNLPVKNSKGFTCIINIYNEEQYQLNTVVEVAGFLSFAPAETFDAFCEGEDLLAPSRIIPHLNAVVVNKLKHSNPLITPSTNLDEIAKNAEFVRAELTTVLKLVMFDDGLAADYLLCYLLSSVFSRQNGLALGKFSLNISNIPKDCNYVKHLYNFLTYLVPKSHYLPLTIENLNKMTFVPVRNYSTNKLQSGLLQLSNNTFLVLDETKLEAGKLEDKGVKNVQALSKVINYQEAHYDFLYYPLEFSTDIPVLILSEGKSMLPSDFHIRLSVKKDYNTETVEESFNKAIQYLKDSNVNKYRMYLSAMASLAYKLSQDLEAQIAEDFVRMRQNIGTTTPQDLHDLLVLARLFSISRGSTTLTMETWEIVQEMEHQRKG